MTFVNYLADIYSCVLVCVNSLFPFVLVTAFWYTWPLHTIAA